jgi:DNA-binding NarL/FixJ family response regulator
MIRPLTPKQCVILQLLAEGNTLKDVAAKMRLSHGTLKVYLYKLRVQCGCRTTVQLVVDHVQGRLASQPVKVHTVVS